ncbi:TPA: YdcF family protein [Listeria monocytogenes]|uniref:YdcF family protein n=1 Tax=Listeria monocytogenes TaxID=1639 RepID=UPI0010D4476D|nr:YdcF family protein [Listeria monocytogenes]EAC9534480.1 YdcF family protein [Listeria monocytogenes]EAF1441177.1 YdcF family protein [Listeria monocytogenes]EAF1542626.1 YdcF family protein [Listeria monocytogenes]ECQ0702587.1 YdcF family protein [Listeria monocytogenes]ECW1546151.1 YdcF family protein [Listeria monocytogenes]
MRRLKRISIILIAIGFIYLLIVAAFMFSGTRAKPSDNADTVLILGAKVNGDPAEPAEVLKERLDAAVTYLNENPTMQVVVSGGQGEDESASEASVMEEYLVNKGITRSRIKIEDKSRRTEENIKYSKGKFNLGKTVIVTSDYHMYRALMLAKRQGLDASGLPAKSRSVIKIKNMMRETLSITYAWVFDR